MKLFVALLFAAAVQAADRPNILWISIEDTSPWLGFCGEKYATTPNLDRLARASIYYNNAFATAPVCAPARYAIITGTYATSYGTQRLRSQFAVPADVTGFPAFLRRAGYYCSNNVKTDYNTSDEKRIIDDSWDDCSSEAHYRNRKPGQPFFAVFNLTETHQSRVFENAPSPLRDPTEAHDPETAPVPPYYPDTPTARRTMARVHDCITAMDKRVGELLAELEREGLKEDTIVFFWSDHGQGIPRGKRTLWDTGLKVPLLISFPKKYRHLAPSAPGSTCDQLVSLMDLGPTLLSLLELAIPPYMHGRAFLGKAAAPPREYVFGARDRVDEVLEVSRAVRDKRFLYIRNFMPDLSWNQPETFSDQLELRREITRLASEGKLNAAQLTYAAPTKPVEELYDTDNDPWQVKNLAADPRHRSTLEQMRKALRDWQLQTRDLGMMHEWQAAKLCGETGRPLIQAAEQIPLERILDTAWRVGLKGQVGEFVKRLNDPDPTVRYWAAIGLRVAGAEAKRAKSALLKALDDESLPVRVEAACVLVKQFDDRAALERLAAVLACGDDNAVVHAARTLELLGKQAHPVVRTMREGLLRTQNMYARWSLQNAIAALTNSSRPPLKTRRPSLRPATGESVQRPESAFSQIAYRYCQAN